MCMKRCNKIMPTGVNRYFVFVGETATSHYNIVSLSIAFIPSFNWFVLDRWSNVNSFAKEYAFDHIRFTKYDKSMYKTGWLLTTKSKVWFNSFSISQVQLHLKSDCELWQVQNISEINVHISYVVYIENLKTNRFHNLRYVWYQYDISV